MNTLYLIIGIPGSGKTTKAKEIIANYNKLNVPIKHFEADMFFEKNGKYIFNPKQLGLAHKWCQDKCRETMTNNIDVIISNTSLMPWERSGYIRMAQEFGYEVKVLTMTGNYQNVHGVPEDKINIMKNKFVKFSENELKQS